MKARKEMKCIDQLPIPLPGGTVRQPCWHGLVTRCGRALGKVECGRCGEYGDQNKENDNSAVVGAKHNQPGRGHGFVLMGRLKQVGSVYICFTGASARNCQMRSNGVGPEEPPAQSLPTPAASMVKRMRFLKC